MMYVYQEFSKVKYHSERGTSIVNNAEEEKTLGGEVVLVFRASNLYRFATSAHPVIGTVIEIRPHFGCVHVLVEEQFVH